MKNYINPSMRFEYVNTLDVISVSDPYGKLPDSWKDLISSGAIDEEEIV